MDWVKLLDKLKLWQFTLFLSICLGTLGFTGEWVLTKDSILDGKEDTAIVGFFVLLAVSILLRYLPPPERRHNGNRDGLSYAEQIIEIEKLKQELANREKEE